jgi:acetyl-CoA C-acetyltransferase
MSQSSAYIIAARRTALGRIGGLHRHRRIDALAAPVVRAVIEDGRLNPERVDELILGNASEGGNPARLVALAAGLPETAAASTIDRQCASGLDAILAAIRAIGAGEADVIVAGGAESLSTAPWRIAKPRSLYQTPRFVPLEQAPEDEPEEPQSFAAAERLSRRLGITRADQDAYALRSHLKAGMARGERRFVGEIVPLKANPEEARDESAVEPDLEDLARLSPFAPPDGLLTPGNTSALHDGAAFVAVVSEKVWAELGKPRALRLVASAAQGVSAEDEAGAPIAAARKLYARLNGINRADIRLVETSETSAAQAIALARSLEIEDQMLNPDGGAIARGHPFGAAGAVLVARLFTRMARARTAEAPALGVAAVGAAGGLGVAALFEAV